MSTPNLGFFDPYPLNTSFSAQTPGLQLAWDSTSLGALKTCPRYYFYLNVLGFASRVESAHLVFGLEFHAALELYDRKKAEGFDHNACVLAAVRQALVKTWNFKLQRPWASDEPTKTRDTLIRSIVWYLDQFSEDPLATAILSNGKPAVELSFQIDGLGLESSKGEEFKLCGHLDRVAYWQGKPWIVDRKTTKGSIGTEYFQKFKPDNQMSLYSVAGSIIFPEPIDGVIIDAAQTLVKSTKFQRGFTYRSTDERQEWLYETSVWLKVAETYAEAQYWPQNDKSCGMFSSYDGEHDTWKGGCPFRPICGQDPVYRNKHLEALYDRRVWNPLVTREV